MVYVSRNMPVVEAVHPAGRREDDAKQYKKSDGVFHHSHLFTLFPEIQNWANLSEYLLQPYAFIIIIGDIDVKSKLVDIHCLSPSKPFNWRF